MEKKGDKKKRTRSHVQLNESASYTEKNGREIIFQNPSKTLHYI